MADQRDSVSYLTVVKEEGCLVCLKVIRNDRNHDVLARIAHNRLNNSAVSCHKRQQVLCRCSAFNCGENKSQCNAKGNIIPI